MATVAVLGMGLLGSGFAENLLAKKHTVRVWNRTASKCAPMAARGATVAATPAEAVRGAERVHLVLTADDAVDAVIAELRAGLGARVPLVDHSTNLPARVAERFSRLRGEGVWYLPAPVFMAPANARDATGLMLLAGPTSDHDALAPALSEMTGRLWHVGEAPERAAVVKLSGNAMMFMLSAAVGDLLSVGAGAGLRADEVLSLFDTWTPSLSWIGKRVARAGESPATFELTMARKDTALAIATAAGRPLSVLPVVAADMDAAIAAGRGADDYAVFARPAE